MEIDFSKLNYKFIKKPLLIGGKAMEYYDLRQSGSDIDFIACEEDVLNLIKLFPDKLKDLGADLGVCPFEFEIWLTIHYLKYESLLDDAIEMPEYMVVSKKNLLYTKVLAMNKEKYLNDVKLIVASRLAEERELYKDQRKFVDSLIGDIKNIRFIEKK